MIFLRWRSDKYIRGMYLNRCEWIRSLMWANQGSFANSESWKISNDCMEDLSKLIPEMKRRRLL